MSRLKKEKTTSVTRTERNLILLYFRLSMILLMNYIWIYEAEWVMKNYKLKSRSSIIRFHPSRMKVAQQHNNEDSISKISHNKSRNQVLAVSKLKEKVRLPSL